MLAVGLWIEPISETLISLKTLLTAKTYFLVLQFKKKYISNFQESFILIPFGMSLAGES